MSLVVELSAGYAGAEAPPDGWTIAESLATDSEWRSAAGKWDDDDDWEDDDWEEDDDDDEDEDDDEEDEEEGEDDEEDDQDDW